MYQPLLVSKSRGFQAEGINIELFLTRDLVNQIVIYVLG
jgi:hypothetical protein